LREAYSEFAKRGVEIVTVSSTELEMTSYVAEVLKAPYPILSDATWSVFYNYGMGSVFGVPLPGVFVIDADGIIRWNWAAPFSPVFTPPPANRLIEVLDMLAESEAVQQ
jgi:peroxiredoxin